MLTHPVYKAIIQITTWRHFDVTFAWADFMNETDEWMGFVLS